MTTHSQRRVCSSAVPALDTYVITTDGDGNTFITHTTGGIINVTDVATDSILTLTINDGAKTTFDYTNDNPLPLAGLNTNSAILEFDGSTGTTPLITTGNEAMVAGTSVRYSNTTQLIDHLTASGGILALAGTTTISDAGDADITVATGATVFFNGSQTIDSLTISPGGTARQISEDTTLGDTVLTIGALDIQTAVVQDENGGILDLGHGDMIVRQGDLSDLYFLLEAGFDGGRWDGFGPSSGPNPASIISLAAANSLSRSIGIGYARIGDVGAPTAGLFDGVTVDDGDVVLRSTTYGDANLDGQLNSDDESQIVSGQSAGLSGWSNGDFNYDGVVDNTDISTFDLYSSLSDVTDINYGAGKIYKITAIGTGRYAYAPWVYVSQTCGPTVLTTTGTAPLIVETRNVRAWFVRPFVELYESNNTAGAVVWLWGSVGYQTGYKDSTGAALGDTCEVLAASPPAVTLPSPYPGVKLPVPGIGLPTVPIAGFAPNWQNFNGPGDPTASVVSVQSTVAIPPGQPDLDPSLPIPPIPAPPAGFI